MQRASKPKMSPNLLDLLVSGAVVVAAPIVGLLVTVLLLRGAFGGTARVDPAEKARVLAEGISEAMNGTAFGLVISVVALVPTLVFAVRLVREKRTTK
jgi:biopolymer transport protein ExbB/TolQ